MPICRSFYVSIFSSSWVETAKKVAEKGMAHCHLAIYSKVLISSTNKRSKKYFTNSQRWDSAADGLAQSLDSPVMILDSISVTSDVRALEPRTRWVWIWIVFFFFPISQERGPPAS